MFKAFTHFIICVALGLGVGAIFYNFILGSQDKPVQLTASPESSSAKADIETPKKQVSSPKTSTDSQSSTATVSADQDNIIAKRGCIQCHSVGALNINGGQVGPDLSQAYTTVESKHGKSIEEFLKQPTSAVMSGVLSKDPLTDEQRQQVLDLLKKASEVKQ